jgi:hypothetical protein
MDLFCVRTTASPRMAILHEEAGLVSSTNAASAVLMQLKMRRRRIYLVIHARLTRFKQSPIIVWHQLLPHLLLLLLRHHYLPNQYLHLGNMTQLLHQMLHQSLHNLKCVPQNLNPQHSKRDLRIIDGPLLNLLVLIGCKIRMLLIMPRHRWKH